MREHEQEVVIFMCCVLLPMLLFSVFLSCLTMLVHMSFFPVCFNHISPPMFNLQVTTHVNIQTSGIQKDNRRVRFECTWKVGAGIQTGKSYLKKQESKFDVLIGLVSRKKKMPKTVHRQTVHRKISGVLYSRIANHVGLISNVDRRFIFVFFLRLQLLNTTICFDLVRLTEDNLCGF